VALGKLSPTSFL
jgi:hypothetical protein